MLRGLLRDSEATKALFEKVGLFKAPELLEKYVIASEVTVEVLDVFLSRVFGTERGSIGAVDLKPLLENLGCVSLRDRTGARGEDLSDEPDKEVEGLRVKVENLERQLCAVQRQLQMQGEVSKLAASLDGRLDKVARECEIRVSRVSEHVARLEAEVGERASVGDVRSLSEDVSRLKEDEQILQNRISDVEGKAAEADRIIRDEIQRDIKTLDAAMLGREFDYDSASPLNGIIARLAHVCGGNVHENGAVKVTSSSCWSHDHGPKNAVELGTDSFFLSNNETNSWICCDFKGRRVAPTSYSIRTSDWSFPKSWVLEVSNDGTDGSWEVADRRDDNFDLNGEYQTRNFAISDPPRWSFRFVRLRQTGENHEGSDYLHITSLELFGTLSHQ